MSWYLFDRYGLLFRFVGRGAAEDDFAAEFKVLEAKHNQDFKAILCRFEGEQSQETEADPAASNSEQSTLTAAPKKTWASVDALKQETTLAFDGPSEVDNVHVHITSKEEVILTNMCEPYPY